MLIYQIYGWAKKMKDDNFLKANNAKHLVAPYGSS